MCLCHEKNGAIPYIDFKASLVISKHTSSLKIKNLYYWIFQALLHQTQQNPVEACSFVFKNQIQWTINTEKAMFLSHSTESVQAA